MASSRRTSTWRLAQPILQVPKTPAKQSDSLTRLVSVSWARHPPVTIHLPVSLHHHGRLHGPSLDLDRLCPHSFWVVTVRRGVGRLLARASGCWRGISEHPLIGWARPTCYPIPQSLPQVVPGIYSSVPLRLTCVGSHMTASTSDRSLIEPQTQPARPFVNQLGPHCLPIQSIQRQPFFIASLSTTSHHFSLTPSSHFINKTRHLAPKPLGSSPYTPGDTPCVCLLSPACRHHGLQTAPFGRPEGIRRDY